MRQIVASWKRLDLLLQAEWNLLMASDFKRMFKVARVKEEMVDRILFMEKRLMELYKLPVGLADGKNENKGYWRAILTQLSSEDRRQFSDLMVQRSLLKDKVAVVNSRILGLVSDRLELIQQMIHVLTGHVSSQDVGYGPTFNKKGKHSPNGARVQGKVEGAVAALGQGKAAQQQCGIKGLKLYEKIQS